MSSTLFFNEDNVYEHLLAAFSMEHVRGQSQEGHTGWFKSRGLIKHIYELNRSITCQYKEKPMPSAQTAIKHVERCHRVYEDGKVMYNIEVIIQREK